MHLEGVRNRINNGPNRLLCLYKKGVFKANIFRKKVPELERLRTAFLNHRSEFFQSVMFQVECIACRLLFVNEKHPNSG